MLYLAMDRPAQARRSLKRMVGAQHRELLDRRLKIWPGPPPADLAADPEMLLRLCVKADADTVVVDSLKDAAVGLTDDEVGARWNRARQTALAAGVEVVELHHLRKNPPASNAAKGIEDLYGSTWIKDGAGSVLLLAGKAGDVFVRLIHLKQPIGEVGPLRLHHDHATGRTSIAEDGVNLWGLARDALDGITAKEAAFALRGDDGDERQPDKNEIERARRRLERMVAGGSLRSVPGDKSAAEDRAKATRWYLADGVPGASRGASREGLAPAGTTGASRAFTPPAQKGITDGITGITHLGASRTGGSLDPGVCPTPDNKEGSPETNGKPRAQPPPAAPTPAQQEALAQLLSFANADTEGDPT